MSKRGKTPSLISGKKPRFVVAKGVRHCKRCDRELSKGTTCIEIPIPGSMGHKTYCQDCFSEILEQSSQDIKKIKADFSAVL
jgi:hypothetical protein